MNDPRIVIPRDLRNAGILIGVLMMVAGLVIGWIRSGQPISLPPTGYKK
jgi:hypothetical protein